MSKEERDYELDKLNKELRHAIGARETEDDQGLNYSESDFSGGIPSIDVSGTVFDEDMPVHKEDKSPPEHTVTQENKKEKRKRRTALTVSLTVLGILLVLTVAAGATFVTLRSRGREQLKESQTEAEITVPENVKAREEGKFIVYNGEKYCYNENVINILCMGVDTSIEKTSDQNIGENGQADVIIMAVLDSKTGKLSLINISREAMVDVNQYNVEGKFLDTRNMQLCLAYAYGDGKEKSCLNTAESVSRLLYGMPVNAYAALDLDGIGVLNDAVGGVSVNVLEDLSSYDSQLQAGQTVTLTGQQAQTYVRSRDTEVLESNNLRMERQKQYLNAFLQKTISEMKSDLSVPLDLYKAASDYMITDISPSEVTYLASLLVQHGITGGDMLTVPGEVRDGGTYAEFIPDDEKLFEMILNVFYTRV